MHRLYRPLIVVLLAAFLLADALLWVSSTIGLGGPGWLFIAVFTAVLGYLAWIFLWRTVYELHLDGDDLSWRAPLRSGSVRLSNVREFRPVRWARNSELIKLDDGKSMIVFMGKGFLPFIDDVTRQAPYLSIRVRPFFSELLEKWPLQGSGGYERHD